jgi:putative hemolysin
MGGAIEIAERPLSQVLVPRNRVSAIDASVPVEAAIAVLRQAGHPRAPIVRGDLDDAIGQVHLRDLIDPVGLAGQRARPILALPETMSVLEALRQLQMSHTALAAVVDEHGGTQASSPSRTSSKNWSARSTTKPTATSSLHNAITTAYF